VKAFLKRFKIGRRDDKPAPASATEAAEATSAPPRPAEPPETTSVPIGVKWRKYIERILASEGYMVQGLSEEMPTGGRLRMWGTDQPFQIIGEATYEDALRQWEVYEEISGEDLEPPPPPSSSWHYYKLGILLSDAR